MTWGFYHIGLENHNGRNQVLPWAFLLSVLLDCLLLNSPLS